MCKISKSETEVKNVIKTSWVARVSPLSRLKATIILIKNRAHYFTDHVVAKTSYTWPPLKLAKGLLFFLFYLVNIAAPYMTLLY